jgi:ketosteroid isomerase-like protein
MAVESNFSRLTFEAIGGITLKTLSAVEVSPLRSFIDRYFEAWHGGVPEEVLGYFSEDAVIRLMGPVGILAGRKMVADKWVIPTVTNYPGNIHQTTNFLEAGDQVAIEWLFTGTHASTGKEIQIPGCSIYWVSRGVIRRGSVYFNPPQPKREPGLSALAPAHRSPLSQTGTQAPSNL